MKKIVILGGGESGVGAAILAQKKGHPVFLSDGGKLKAEYRSELDGLNIPYEENYHTLEKITQADLVVKSPGVPDDAPVVQALNQAGVPVIGEIEFAGKHTNAVIIAITGSNGKTTTTGLAHHLLLQGGIDAGLGGNIGRSFARLVADEPHDTYVLELSSFQLDGIDYFQPDVAVLLNITPDHLDRYGDNIAHYVASKFRIIRNQESADLFIYNADDKRISDFLTHYALPQRTITIGDGFYQEGFLVIDDNTRFDMRKGQLKGPHNMFNAICAVHVAMSQGVSPEAIQTGLDSFINVPHRLEEVAVIDGIAYVNDSKATNVDALYHALLSMTTPTVLILGGVDKGNDYSDIISLVQEKVPAIVCLGIDNEKIKTTFGHLVSTIVETDNMKDAVEKSTYLAHPGDTVLLSPACASFDLFKNYMDRGDQFRGVVNQLIG